MRTNLYDEKDGLFNVYGGATIDATITEAIALAAKEKRRIAFEFNGVTVRVDGGSVAPLIQRDWSRAMSGAVEPPIIGPYPAAELTESERDHDADVERRNEERRAASQAIYAAKQKAKELEAAAKLSSAPPLDLKDAEGWAKGLAANSDPYGGAVYTFAERWARLMQVEMAAGEKMANIADRLVSEADIEGITGFMYGCAVSVLSHCWAHGEELRRWHNLKTQIGTEGERANASGGVLNPALLSIGE